MQEKRQNISVIKSRLLEYIDFKGIKRPEFCRNSKISESLLKGSGLESEIGGDKLVSILSFYDDIDSNWLLTGKGDMIINQNTNENEPEMDCNNCHYKKMADKYENLVDRLNQENERLNDELNVLRRQDRPQSKRQSA